ncbi:DUF6482 family protein [Pseudomonas sp. UBA2684]|uniref:DUF6482 family protein n=1 Tax=Pseudomonas sp. UBA2684 TaxID=1947311 RepID=UPI000E9C1F2D|nr:DUF6482 family protein [Pseudomonas sp. UBA2684]HBX56860.1 cation transporter [Pseudomonas sp.]|tara:strand:- start:38702 stop:39007 length:306 start_codon:yes stop_codon:yes gene_type:complete
MNLHDLSSHAHAGHIDELNLISIEGGIYVLEARMDGRAHPLNDGNGRTLHLRSVEHARDLLHELPKLPFNLVHAVVHDEMCGMQDGTQDTLRVPLSISSAW